MARANRAGRCILIALLSVAMLAATNAVSATRASQNLEIAATDNYFWSTRASSSTVVVAVGDSVTWVNHGNNVHNTIADDGSWRSTTLRPGESFAHTFTRAGTFTYVCTLHLNEEMYAKVIVTAAPTISPTPAPLLARRTLLPVTAR